MAKNIRYGEYVQAVTVDSNTISYDKLMPKPRLDKNGKEIKVRTISEAIDNGLAYATEDRKRYGLNLIEDIKRNAQHYIDNARLYAQELCALEPSSVIGAKEA